jgi:hypothetical protein
MLTRWLTPTPIRMPQPLPWPLRSAWTSGSVSQSAWA